MKHIFRIALLSLIFSGDIWAGKLDSFEKRANQNKSSDTSRHNTKSENRYTDTSDYKRNHNRGCHAADSIDDALGNFFLELLGHSMLYGGSSSLTRVNHSYCENPDDKQYLALLLGWHYSSLKVGYRWVTTYNESLNGPYAGLSIHF